jgi:hypothetical protein
MKSKAVQIPLLAMLLILLVVLLWLDQRSKAWKSERGDVFKSLSSIVALFKDEAGRYPRNTDDLLSCEPMMGDLLKRTYGESYRSILVFPSQQGEGNPIIKEATPLRSGIFNKGSFEVESSGNVVFRDQ